MSWIIILDVQAEGKQNALIEHIQVLVLMLREKEDGEHISGRPSFLSGT